MGYGHWTRTDFEAYSISRGRKVTSDGRLDSKLSDKQIYTQTGLSPLLNPKNVMRECCDSADHPQSIPVILALDVTGSMGRAAAEVAKIMNVVMTELYNRVRDVEFMIMGIGDLAYDRAPIQISQFESDIRIAEQLDHLYMEYGGGGNAYESYTAAWYMAAYHTRLDSWKRGKKGLLITMGDEPLNPYLPATPLAYATGDSVQSDVETRPLFEDVNKKYEVVHIHVSHDRVDRYMEDVKSSFGSVLNQGHLGITSVEGISKMLVNTISSFATASVNSSVTATAKTDDAPKNARVIGFKS